MFYGGYGLHGKSSDPERLPDDRAGRALRRRALRIHHALGAPPDRRGARSLRRYVSVSLHCELAEILTAYTKIVEREGKLAGARGLQRGAAAALRGAGDLDRVVPRERDRVPQHQPAAPVVEEGDRRGADDAAGVPAHAVPARGDGRPPAARHRLRLRRAGEGQSADPPARRRRGAVAGGARTQGGLGRQRPRVLLGREESTAPSSRRTSGSRNPASAAPNTCSPGC